jgi:hypothetical protein
MANYNSTQSSFSRAGSTDEVLAGAAKLASKMSGMRIDGVEPAAHAELNGSTRKAALQNGIA